MEKVMEKVHYLQSTSFRITVFIYDFNSAVSRLILLERKSDRESLS